MITFTHKGDFSKTEKFLRRINKKNLVRLEKYGQMGVDALASNTPKDSGLTASSWSYEVKRTNSGAAIVWKNSSSNKGVSIAVILQYGHGTGSGAYVEGVDYINPAIAPIFKQLSNDAWNEVRRHE